MISPPALLVINAVGLTARQVGARTPALQALAKRGLMTPMSGVLPALTCPAQATMLTGAPPSGHGIVANGWMDRADTEVRFWRQSNRLLQAEPLYESARKRAEALGRPFTCAKLFWWFNQGARVDYSLTPKPHYGCDGGKAFDVLGMPRALEGEVRAACGPFPFPAFWGPFAGEASSRWIARATSFVLRKYRPTLTFCYLPHLDYDHQRFGPFSQAGVAALSVLDECVAVLEETARAVEARVIVVSEYGITPVSRAVFPNRALRRAGLLQVRDGPFGEAPLLAESEAFAVCDHQIAHVYLRTPARAAEVAALFSQVPGVAACLSGQSLEDAGLAHPRGGDLVLLSAPDAWLAYPFWLDDAQAPDYARTVDIHRKPGYDPCELFLDPRLRAPKLRLGLRLLQKKLGMRYRMDATPLDASLVRGSHGLPAEDPLDGPVYLADDANPAPPGSLYEIRNLVLAALGLGA